MHNVNGHDWMTEATTNEHLQDLHQQADKQRLANSVRDNQAYTNNITSRALLPTLIAGLLGLLGIN